MEMAEANPSVAPTTVPMHTLPMCIYQMHVLLSLVNHNRGRVGSLWQSTALMYLMRVSKNKNNFSVLKGPEHTLTHIMTKFFKKWWSLIWTGTWQLKCLWVCETWLCDSGLDRCKEKDASDKYTTQMCWGGKGTFLVLTNKWVGQGHRLLIPM